MWAHSANSKGRRHRLDDHLRGTADLARGFGSAFGLADLAWWTGLIHDGGKAWCAWQEKLLRAEPTGSRVGIDHKSYGVQLARQFGLKPIEWAVAGHHGGLTNRAEVDDLFGFTEEHGSGRGGAWADADRTLKTLVPEIYDRVPTLPADFSSGTDKLTKEFALRFLFSCLVDADALDTRAHRLDLPAPVIGPDMDAGMLLDRLLRRRQAHLEGRARSPMRDTRELVFDAALQAGVRPSGVFRMTAPTGAAKTIAGGAFALTHAAHHRKRRVIVAVPFITITEQNAAVYRELLDPGDPDADRVVLEHHSAVDFGPDDTKQRWYDWRRLAAENWDVPFVVTTTVQLLESLFGRKPSQVRKVHRLTHSVIIFDEVQALPHRLLPQVADAIRILTSRFGVTVLLSSATQPELSSLDPMRKVPAQEIVPDVPGVFERAKRVRYQWLTRPRPALAGVVRDASTHHQVLMVVNTVRDARQVYRLARESTANHAYLHLSTGMCGAHRRRVLTEAKELLADDAPLFLVSTSLVEAGVDIDFPVVYRALGPPDSLAQAAGRCNREGSLGPNGGLVVIFDPADGGAPPSYRTQVEKARDHFGPDRADPEDVVALSAYFTDLYGTLGVEMRGGAAWTIARNRRAWDFRAVADGPLDGGTDKRDRSKAFRLINDDTVPVVVPYGDEAERSAVESWLARLRGDRADREALRRLQPYLATLFRRTAARPEVSALLCPVVGDLVEWLGEYDDGFGMVLEVRGEDYIW